MKVNAVSLLNFTFGVSHFVNLVGEIRLLIKSCL